MVSKISALLLGLIFASQLAFSMETEDQSLSLQDKESLENTFIALLKTAPKIKIMVFGNDESKEESTIIIKDFLKISLDGGSAQYKNHLSYKKYTQDMLVFGKKIALEIFDIKVSLEMDEAAQDEMSANIADEIKEDAASCIFIWVSKMSRPINIKELQIITLLNKKLQNIKTPKRIDKLGILLTSCTSMPLFYESQLLLELGKKQRQCKQQSPEEREKIISRCKEERRNCHRSFQESCYSSWESCPSLADIRLFFAEHDSDASLYCTFGAPKLLSGQKPDVEFIKLIGQLTDIPQIFGTLTALVFSEISNQNLILKDELDKDDLEVVNDWLLKHAKAQG